MSEPKYVFDTNIFINLKNRYPSDIFTSLWEQIETLFSNGIIISSDEVIDEIKRGNDDLEEWANARKDSFYPSNEPVQIIVKEILGQFSGLVTNPKNRTRQILFLLHWQGKRPVLWLQKKIAAGMIHRQKFLIYVITIISGALSLSSF